MKIAYAVVLVLAQLSFAETADLLANGDLEQWENRSPVGWRYINFWGAKGNFGVDDSQHHDGARCVRISASDSTQSYLYSDPVPVAAGEEITARAWVKMQDVPDEGAVVMVANFFQGDKRTEDFIDFAKAPAKDDDGQWKLIEGTVKVPPLSETVRLRVGFRDTHGTCWIDEVSLTAKESLVGRAELAHPRITPEMGGVPVRVINRGQAAEDVDVEVKLGSERGSTKLNIGAATTRSAVVPVKVEKRETLPLSVSVMRPGSFKWVWLEKRQVTVPPEIVMSPCIPTHWALEDGPGRIEGDVDLAVTKERREKSELIVRLMDRGAGKELAKWSSGEVKDGFNHFEIKAPELPVGEYRVIAQLRMKDQMQDLIQSHQIMAEQPWVVIHRSQSKVVLNKDGYLEHEGKAIFPLGIFNGNGRDKEMGEAGFTVQHAYNAANVEIGARPDDAAAKSFIDRAQANGMKALFLIPRGLAFGGDWENFRRRIRMFRNHPALLAWDEEEGLARGDMDMKALEKMRQIIAEEDPNHPFMVGDSRDVITQVKDRSNFFPLQYMDLGMWWWYPIPPGAGKANMLEGDEKTKMLELEPPSFLVKRNTDKPLWVGVQSYRKPGKGNRYPTAAEYRAQAYISVIHGAKGLMWYGGHVEGGIFLHPKQGSWDYLQGLVSELREMAPVFMSPDDQPPTLSPATLPISIRMKRLSDRHVILAANRGADRVEAKLQLPGMTPSAIKVLYENRTLTSEGNTITDRFGPYEVHVYEIDRK